MTHCRDDAIGQIGHLQPQGSGVDAGVEADVVAVQDIGVNKKLYPVFLIVDQSQYAQRTGGDVQKRFHVFASCEA